MNQFRKFLRQSCLFMILTAIGAVGIAAAAELSPRQKQLNNQAEACKSEKEYGCAKICLVAAKNPGDADLGEKCDRFYRDAIPMSSQPAGQPQPKPLQYTLRDQVGFCKMKKDRSCAEACANAMRNSSDASAVEQCNAEHQRVLAANPPPPPKAEEGMSLAQRIALMPDKKAYCETKKAVNRERTMRRPLDGCVGACGDKRVTDQRYPESQRESFVATCERLYYGIFEKLGK